MQGLIYSVTKLHATFLTFTCNGLTLINFYRSSKRRRKLCMPRHTYYYYYNGVLYTWTTINF